MGLKFDSEDDEMTWVMYLIVQTSTDVALAALALTAWIAVATILAFAAMTFRSTRPAIAGSAATKDAEICIINFRC